MFDHFEQIADLFNAWNRTLQNSRFIFQVAVGTLLLCFQVHLTYLA